MIVSKFYHRQMLTFEYFERLCLIHYWTYVASFNWLNFSFYYLMIFWKFYCARVVNNFVFRRKLSRRSSLTFFSRFNSFQLNLNVDFAFVAFQHSFRARVVVFSFFETNCRNARHWRFLLFLFVSIESERRSCVRRFLTLCSISFF